MSATTYKPRTGFWSLPILSHIANYLARREDKRRRNDILYGVEYHDIEGVPTVFGYELELPEGDSDDLDSAIPLDQAAAD